jgi:hypothetical protein
VYCREKENCIPGDNIEVFVADYGVALTGEGSWHCCYGYHGISDVSRCCQSLDIFQKMDCTSSFLRTSKEQIDIVGKGILIPEVTQDINRRDVTP